MVADAINGAVWTLPHPRSQQEVELHTYVTTITFPLTHDIDDCYEWLAGDCPIHSFSSFNTLKALRPKMEVKDCHDVVWFKGALPKHAFTMWTANYDRLPAKARLAGWGIQISPLCSFCSNAIETREHLFLAWATGLTFGVRSSVDAILPPRHSQIGLSCSLGYDSLFLKVFFYLGSLLRKRWYFISGNSGII